MNSENFSNIPMISQPQDIKVNLYSHQLASIYKMEEFENNRTSGKTISIPDRDSSRKYLNCEYESNIGINADSTGYGKTLSMITLIYRNKMEWDGIKKEPYKQSRICSLAGGRMKRSQERSYERLDTTLILVGPSLIKQWYEEALKVPLEVKMITKKKEVVQIDVENYDIILITPYCYNDIILKYSEKAWKRFIFDEPGHIRVTLMKPVVAGFIWFVTATPESMWPNHCNCRRSFINNIIDNSKWDRDMYSWWRIFRESQSGFSSLDERKGVEGQHYSRIFLLLLKNCGVLLVRNSDAFIKYSYSMPVTIHKYYKCYNPLYHTVKGFVTPRIMSMISAGDIRGAIQSLGGDETGNITEMVKIKKLEEIEEIKLRIKILLIRNKKKMIIKLEGRIIRLSKQISELNNRYKNLLQSKCNICLGNIQKPVMEPNCQNIFCGECLLKWVEMKTPQNCPLCRKHIVLKDLIYIREGDSKDGGGGSTTKEKGKSRDLTKVERTLKIIKSRPKGKFILFSGWNGSDFNSISQVLRANNIKYINELKGRSVTREKILSRFKTGDISVLFLTSRENTAGLNLQEASDIIVYHTMPEENLNQILGRANRIGRFGSLRVHHLLV